MTTFTTTDRETKRAQLWQLEQLLDMLEPTLVRSMCWSVAHAKVYRSATYATIQCLNEEYRRQIERSIAERLSSRAR